MLEPERYQEGRVLVLAPDGDLDLTNADALRAAALDRAPEATAAIIVDLSRVQYLDSAGIHVLFAIARRLGERRRPMALVVPAGSALRRVLGIAGLEPHLVLDEDLDGARRRLSGLLGPGATGTQTTER